MGYYIKRLPGIIYCPSNSLWTFLMDSPSLNTGITMDISGGWLFMTYIFLPHSPDNFFALHGA